jgi:hypothetical protein
MKFDLYAPTRGDAFDNLVPIKSLDETHSTQNFQFRALQFKAGLWLMARGRSDLGLKIPFKWLHILPGVMIVCFLSSGW